MGSLILHIGVPKSGTTYIQGILAQNRDELSDRGWMYPGGRSNQQHAIYGICRDDIGFLKSADAYVSSGNNLRKKVSEFISQESGHMAVSAEVLAMLSDEAIARFIANIGIPERVVVTARGLHSLLLSTWQQSLKTGHTETLPHMIDRFERVGLHGAQEWLGLLYGGVIRRWSAVAPVHVVVVPPPVEGENAFWELFREASGVPQLEDLSVDAKDANISLTREAAAILRQMNVQFKASDMPFGSGEEIRRRFLRSGVFPLAGGRDGGDKLKLTDGLRERILEWNGREIELLREHAEQVHGDLKHLEDSLEVSSVVPPLKPEKVAGVAAAQLVEILKGSVGVGDGDAGA